MWGLARSANKTGDPRLDSWKGYIYAYRKSVEEELCEVFYSDNELRCHSLEAITLLPPGRIKND